jgi:phosphoribosyl 1,2-cyclic phosphodiesterase
MKIRLWGTRGSIPSPGPSTLRFGGNTSCVEVRLQDGTLIILDAGSGIRPLGAALGSVEAVLLLSHYHWDHIQGMPFFIPAYSPKSVIRVVGPEYDGRGPSEWLTGQMMAPYFPAPAADWLGIVSFEVTPKGSFSLGSACVSSCYLSHPGVTLAYRIEEAGKSFVYMSDNEVEIAPPEMLSKIIELARGADLLLHDCQYFESEYATRHHWGHSTPRQAMRVAREAGVSNLLLFHHDPTHSDEQVEMLAEEAKQLAGDVQVLIGRESDVIDLAAFGREAAEEKRAARKKPGASRVRTSAAGM